jgi:hypothetical protein
MLMDIMFEKIIFINCSVAGKVLSNNEIQKGVLLRNIHKNGCFMNRYY